MLFAGTLEGILCAHAANMIFLEETLTTDATSVHTIVTVVKGNYLEWLYIVKLYFGNL